MFYEKDIDPVCRKSNPSFYGVFPAGVLARTKTLLVLMVFTMCHVLSRCLGLALLWSTFGGLAAAGFWVADFLLVCLIKVVQGDFIYWLPIDNLGLAIAVSTLTRMAAKILTDFTGMFQMRHSWGKKVGNAFKHFPSLASKPYLGLCLSNKNISPRDISHISSTITRGTTFRTWVRESV
jgi:hypothetical protein